MQKRCEEHAFNKCSMCTLKKALCAAQTNTRMLKRYAFIIPRRNNTTCSCKKGVRNTRSTSVWRVKTSLRAQHKQSPQHAHAQKAPTLKAPNVHAVCLSSAESEPVWSMAGHVLSKHHASLSPLVFELIMYLKYNSRLWSLSDVIEANKRRKNESPAAKKRLAAQTERLNNRRAEVTTWDQGIETDLLIDVENDE